MPLEDTTHVPEIEGMDSEERTVAAKLPSDPLPSWGLRLSRLSEPHPSWPLESVGGWIVQACVVGSPAWAAGLRKWDVIFDVGGRLPARLEDFPDFPLTQRIAVFRLARETIEISLRPR